MRGRLVLVCDLSCGIAPPSVVLQTVIPPLLMFLMVQAARVPLPEVNSTLTEMVTPLMAAIAPRIQVVVGVAVEAISTMSPTAMLAVDATVNASVATETGRLVTLVVVVTVGVKSVSLAISAPS